MPGVGLVRLDIRPFLTIGIHDHQDISLSHYINGLPVVQDTRRIKNKHHCNCNMHLTDLCILIKQLNNSPCSLKVEYLNLSFHVARGISAKVITPLTVSCSTFQV